MANVNTVTNTNKDQLEKEVRSLMERFKPSWEEILTSKLISYKVARENYVSTRNWVKPYYPIEFGIRCTKEENTLLYRLVKSTDHDYSIPKEKRGGYVIVANYEAEIKRLVSEETEKAIAQSIKNLEGSLKRKYDTDIESIQIHGLWLGNDGMLNGKFTINGEFYSATTILAWGEKNRPHYRFLLHKYKA